MPYHIRSVTVALIFGILLAVSARSQNITSSILGQVTDPSGGNVPQARVEATNAGTGIIYETRTGTSGAYTIPNLQPGVYSITVEKDGFNTYRTTSIRVLAAQAVRVDIKLQLGAVQQTVSVSGGAPLVHTDTQTISGSVTARQISDLPNSLQSIDALMALQPGVDVARSVSNPTISGSSYWGGNNFNLNGVSVDDVGNGGAAYSYGLGMVNLPPSNSLQEFKVDSGDMNAEYRGVGSVTMVLKQGTNQFHGEAYEFLQNRRLNANQFLLNATGQPRPSFDRNLFGGDLGGPILHNKVFFFADYYGLRQHTPVATSLEFPSTAMRKGDFSALCSGYNANGVCSASGGTQLYNPFTGQPFPNNQIPAGLITSQAQKLLQFMPDPTNLSSAALPFGAPNYVSSVENLFGVNNTDERIDWQASNRDSVNGFLRWSRGSPWFQATGTPPNYGNNANFGYTDWAVSATETHSFGATAVNELRAAWVEHASTRTGQNGDFKPWTLFPQLPVQNTGGLPTVNISGYKGLTDFGAGLPFPFYDVEISDNFTYLHGRHTFKMGVDETGYKNNIPEGDGNLTAPLGEPLGTLDFTGEWTGGKGWPGMASSQGNAFADFLLGTLNSSNYATILNSMLLSSREWDFYGQDTWQATPRLTLNYGLRYMYQAPWRVRDNRVSYLDLANGKLALPQNSGTLATPPYAIARLMSVYPLETTQQAGFPLSYFKGDKNNFGPRFGFAWRPLGGSSTVIRGGWGVYYNFIPGLIGQMENTFDPPWRDGPTFTTLLPGNPTTPFLPDLTFQNAFPTGVAAAPPANPLVYMTDSNLVNPVVQQWNLTVERQFGQNWMGRVSYLGAQTHHDLWYASNINIPNLQESNVPLQAQRPIQPWSSIYETATGGHANFNQLQLEMIKRFAQGLSFQVEYSYTRSLDDVPIVGGAQNPHDFNADYGNSDSMPRHNLVFNYIYDLPVGQGRHWLTNAHGVVNEVLGGWEVSGITTYRSGTPFSVGFSVPSSIVGWWGGRADRVSGVPLYTGQQSSSHDIVGGVQWFNPAAFAPPQPWTWGDSSRNSVFGPGFADWDISLLKNFAIKEQTRLQFRADMFDAFNHFNLGNPSSTIADTRDGGLPISTTGRIYGGSGSRVIQLGLKLIF